MDLWLSSLQSKATHLLVTEIHALFLESGFVGFNSVTGAPIENFPDLPNSGQSSTLSISYTLPTLLHLARNDRIENPPSVLVKFQTLGGFLVICGSLARDGSSLYRRKVHKSKAFSSVIMYGNVSEFRRRLKDGLCFPLLIDISEAAGLPGPNCFSTLPNELKVGIMALLPATAIARMECVCANLRSLSSSGDDQLWGTKFADVFGEVQGLEPGSSLSMAVATTWKQRFVRTVMKKRKQERARNLAKEQALMRYWDWGQQGQLQELVRLAGDAAAN
ncbi:unnamed protein product [Linum trigynum]|uniref:F-box domain-containing protein n=1 Tax=Linum trigynum TaxID=586398 RepID=A0AAV2G375_9ROSI